MSKAFAGFEHLFIVGTCTDTSANPSCFGSTFGGITEELPYQDATNGQVYCAGTVPFP